MLTHIGLSEKVFIMNRLILILIFIFGLQSWLKADDITEFQIEGMSIGDSLLNYYGQDKIIKKLKNTKQYYNNNDYKLIVFYNSTLNYDGFRFHLRSKDKTYKIYQISGYKKMNFEKCKNIKDDVADEIEGSFQSAIRKDGKIKKHAYDKSGKSKTISSFFNLDSGRINISCTDWSSELTKEKQWNDKLNVGIYSKEFIYWINNVAYK